MTVPQEGENDDNPIRLQGDTANEFRALLWALYALSVMTSHYNFYRYIYNPYRPHELMVANTADANCTQLVNLARITHKYQFRSIESWALSALHTHYSNPNAFDSLPSSHPPALPHPHQPTVELRSPSLVQITELAALCDRSDLLNPAITRWKRQIGEGKDLALAIDIGERFNLRSMLGLAYNGMMLLGKSSWDQDPLLTREQKIRLLSGAYSLAKLCDALPTQPPSISHTARCTNQQRCNKAWNGVWKIVLDVSTQVMLGMQREDVLARLVFAESMMKAFVEEKIPSQGFLDGITTCRESALIATKARVREFRESLADYFSDDF